MNKISFCTVCRNRLEHLRQTLPVNIRENAGNVDLEFIVVDYNSPDGLEDWMRSEMMEHIQSGILKYYKTKDPAHFTMSHSKNMGPRLATGNIISLLDADNYAGYRYAQWVDQVFMQKGKKTVIALGEVNSQTYGDTLGKISCHKDLFEKVRGFDEAMEGYGMEDFDFVERLLRAGGERVNIENPAHLKFIAHSNEERIQNFRFVKNLDSIYVNMAGNDPSTKQVLYLMKDDTWSEIAFRFNEQYQGIKALSFAGWYAEKGGYHHGKLERQGNEMKLAERGIRLRKQAYGQLFSYNGGPQHQVWQEIPADSPFYASLVLSYSDCLNRLIYQENAQLGRPINPEGWGKGVVYKNFDYDNPIRL
jgi:glycosyltransferase involved in cell wall biosynthesis